MGMAFTSPAAMAEKVAPLTDRLSQTQNELDDQIGRLVDLADRLGGPAPMPSEGNIMPAPLGAVERALLRAVQQAQTLRSIADRLGVL